MKKKSRTYVCQECGHQHSKWLGKCDACNQWNTLQEEVLDASVAKLQSRLEVAALNDVSYTNNNDLRVKTNISEFDRVLGGGFAPGSVILLGGEPGIGKSTLVLQILDKISSTEYKTLYLSGEESSAQIRSRALRLGIANNNINLSNSCNAEELLEHLNKARVDFIVIDSLQTIFSNDLSAAPGTVSQLKHSAFKIIELAKRKMITVIFIGHITKDGQIAGPKVLEHMVDAVFYFEPERASNLRVLRSYKNRFGPVNEIGIFEMESKGLIPVTNPSKIFLSDQHSEVSGVTIFAGMEGTRPVLFEIQALVLPTFMASPRRAVVGWDMARLSMILAILGARININLSNKEVYLNVAGGIKLDDPSADLAVAAALISAVWNKKVDRSNVFCGELALSGDIREPAMLMNRMKESQNLGFGKFISNIKDTKNDCKIEQLTLKNIFDLVKFFQSN